MTTSNEIKPATPVEVSDGGRCAVAVGSAPTAREEIDAIGSTLRAIQSFPLDARRRVLTFAWAWAHDAKTLPNNSGLPRRVSDVGSDPGLNQAAARRRGAGVVG